MDSLVLLGSGCLICLLPLSLYFLFLSFLHSRRQPTLLTGRWDFTCLLLGLSGFLILFGPMVLSILDSAWRSIWLSGSFEQVRVVLKKQAIFWSMVATCYLAFLAIMIRRLLHKRASFSIVYGLPTESFDDLFGGILERMNRVWRRQPDGFEIGPDRESLPGEGKPETFPLSEVSEVGVDLFPTMRNVTLRWEETDPDLRHVLEGELIQSLARTNVAPHPVSGWFLTASVTLFSVMCVWMLFLIYSMWNQK